MATARARTLLPAGWRTIHQLRGSGLEQVDCVMVGPAGVFVVSSAPTAQGAAIAAVADAALTVLARLPGLDPDLVTPVLRVGREDQPTIKVHGVLVCAAGSLVEQLMEQQNVLDKADVGSVSSRLQFARPDSEYWSAPVRRAPRAPAAPRAPRHQPWTPGSQASPAVRAALICIAVSLTLCPLIQRFVWPIVDQLSAFLHSVLR